VSTLAIVLVAVGALLIVLVVGGIIVTGRRRRADDGALDAELAAANEALAQARAQDKGWERAGLERAALDAFARRSQAPVRALHLVQVVDRPGTEDDQAVFRVVTQDGAQHVHLLRRGDGWLADDQA
jgi:hypothetical protein